MFTLIALGTGVAYVYSLVGTVAPASFPPPYAPMAAVPVYFEAAAVITVLVLLGQVLELRARETTSGAIKALLGLAPKTPAASRQAPTKKSRRPVQVGDRLRVRPGEKVPVEAWFVEGPAC